MMSAMKRALESALVENPDDLASHSAYADWLMEQGDPRGEFIQVQLALEDASKPAAERKRLRQRETALLKKHAKEWLGETARFLLGERVGSDTPWRYSFRRGWRLDQGRHLGPQEGRRRGVDRRSAARSGR
ncbi:MAG: TIGR02996 domain-containing protein [Gemmataceae bacterium]|nr:TIGR02996 domain-containing protein [Gemmataceae bacterium]